MTTKNRPTNRNHPKHIQQKSQSSGMLRLFSLVMLFLMALTSFGRFTAANRRAQPGGTAAQALSLHRQSSTSSTCEDLTVTTMGEATYSSCSNGVEKQYTLSTAERQKLQAWIETYQAVNYDHQDNTEGDNTRTQLFLNGQGSQKASAADTQQMIDFATTLDAKIAAH